jgi:hypothetical protein
LPAAISRCPLLTALTVIAGRALRDRQQDHSADGREPEEIVQPVRRLRQSDAGDPGRHRSTREEKQQGRHAKIVHAFVCPGSTSNDVDLLSVSFPACLPMPGIRAMLGDAATSRCHACAPLASYG